MRRFLLLLLFIFSSAKLLHSHELPVDTINKEKLTKGYELDQGWLFSIHDSIEFSQLNYDDIKWARHSEEKAENFLDSLFKQPPFILWFRIHFLVDSTLHQKIVTLQFIVKDACEVYLDGKKLQSFGTLKTDNQQGVSGFTLKPIPIPLILNSGEHLLAVRYSGFGKGGDQRPLQFDVIQTDTGFEATFSTIENTLADLADTSDVFIYAFFSGIFITLSLFHLILFLFYRNNRINLYYSLFTFLLFIIFFGIYKITGGSDLYTTTLIGILEVASILSVPLLFITLLYQIFYKRILIYFWILGAALTTGLLLLIYSEMQNIGGLLILVYILLSLVEILRVYIIAWRKKKEGAGIFLFGILIPPIGTLGLALAAYILKAFGLESVSTVIGASLNSFFAYSMLLSVSISMTIYLAKEFSRINLKLSGQLSEIKHLFQKTIFQENERKRILENQNIELEKKVEERTRELALKNRDILDNLKYAQRIQSAILPETGLIFKTLKDSFILYRPKDIVSGDFYTFSQKNGKVVIAAADCTGHGVTGAFLSMIGISLLNQLVNEGGHTEPAQILNLLNTGIVSALKQKANDVSDGMDIAICSFDLNNKTLQFAGANRPLYIIRMGILEEVKPDKLAIGGFRLNTEASFSNHELTLSEGDSVFLFTDGFADQFGGEKGKKMLSKRLREELLSMKDLTMHEQGIKLTQYFDQWKGSNEQVDDVLLIGIKV